MTSLHPVFQQPVFMAQQEPFVIDKSKGLGDSVRRKLEELKEAWNKLMNGTCDEHANKVLQAAKRYNETMRAIQLTVRNAMKNMPDGPGKAGLLQSMQERYNSVYDKYRDDVKNLFQRCGGGSGEGVYSELFKGIGVINAEMNEKWNMFNNDVELAKAIIYDNARFMGFLRKFDKGLVPGGQYNGTTGMPAFRPVFGK